MIIGKIQREYKFEIEIREGRNSKKIIINTEMISYATADNLSTKLNHKGIHYKIMEIDLRCGNEGGSRANYCMEFFLAIYNGIV